MISDRDNDNAEPLLLEMRGIRKSFPGVQAVKSGHFELLAGEIHALVGENGAGKSTLIKILTGAHRADSGTVYLHGRPVIFESPLAARQAGITTIYQEFTLIPSMTVRDNLFLGRELTRGGGIDYRAEHTMAKELLARLGATIEPDARIDELSVAQQQMVEIARALVTKAEILIMDEPTAAIAPREVKTLFDLLKGLAQQGMGIVFISHRLDEVFTAADRITVMRDGETIGTWSSGDLTRGTLIEYMVGRPLAEEFPRRQTMPGEICFEVRGLSGGKVRNVSFAARRGEVLGLAGLMGAGRTEVARLIFGADAKESGEVFLDGKALAIDSPRAAIANGICLLTEDRKSEGLILKASARDNFSLPSLSAWSQLGFIDRKRERDRFSDRVSTLNIRVSGPGQLAEELSGGNQQKLLVARWLETNFQVILFDEPTRGIDVGAKYEMYQLINGLAAQGKVVIVISSELPEILGICDRILVMRDGHLAGEIPEAPHATQEEVMALAT